MNIARHGDGRSTMMWTWCSVIASLLALIIGFSLVLVFNHILVVPTMHDIDQVQTDCYVTGIQLTLPHHSCNTTPNYSQHYMGTNSSPLLIVRTSSLGMGCSLQPRATDLHLQKRPLSSIKYCVVVRIVYYGLGGDLSNAVLSMDQTNRQSKVRTWPFYIILWHKGVTTESTSFA